jgi:pimeloyl-ACP methyl ester carboxylesterase
MILWAHGLEGSPTGLKVRALRAAGLSVEAPDGRGLPLAPRVALLDAAAARLCAEGPLLLAGSSYGGLAAAWLAATHPERFVGLLLLAPALHHNEPPLSPAWVPRPPAGMPVWVVHGLQDDIVPIAASRAYVAGAAAAGLVEVQDGHGLSGSLAKIVALARELGG